jgi:hypothetical protein
MSSEKEQAGKKEVEKLVVSLVNDLCDIVNDPHLVSSVDVKKALCNLLHRVEHQVDTIQKVIEERTV